jgi:hypothetical protein
MVPTHLLSYVGPVPGGAYSSPSPTPSPLSGRRRKRRSSPGEVLERTASVDALLSHQREKREEHVSPSGDYNDPRALGDVQTSVITENAFLMNYMNVRTKFPCFLWLSLSIILVFCNILYVSAE